MANERKEMVIIRGFAGYSKPLFLHEKDQKRLENVPVWEYNIK